MSAHGGTCCGKWSLRLRLDVDNPSDNNEKSVYDVVAQWECSCVPKRDNTDCGLAQDILKIIA